MAMGAYRTIRRSLSSVQQSQPRATNDSHGQYFGIDQLQSEDYAALLTAIDGLRQAHIDLDINLPQIVVCGNQSSGKSSVLEAIAGIQFPIGAGTTTFFATEVILRRDIREAMRARLIASSERQDAMKTNIESFIRSSGSSDDVDFARIIKEAEDHLRSIDSEAGFWKDWLRIEISGPSQLHLTLVDLPGIIQFQEDIPGTRQKILDLLQTYVENRRTTILAIIDGTYEYHNQGILEVISTTARDRTIGIITKADMLRDGSDHLHNIVNLAKNEGFPLRLGWHVLSNLAHEETDRSSLRRNEAERQVFARRHWSSLPMNDFCDVGIKSLRSRLSSQLFKTIVSELPDLLTEMRLKQRQCRNVLDGLGPSRNSIQEQRKYLSDVLNKLSRLIGFALDGDYDRDEFSGFFDGSLEKNLRDNINLKTDDFVKRMRIDGKQYHVYLEETENGDRSIDSDLDEFDTRERLNFSAPFTTASSIGANGQVRAFCVHLKTYCKALARHMRGTRGKNLPGMPSMKNVRPIFRQLSLPWTGLLENFAEDCCTAVRAFLRLAIRHVAGTQTGDALVRTYMHSDGNNLDRRRVSLEAKIKELLWPYKECHPLTYHPNFISDANRHSETWVELARWNRYTTAQIEAADALDCAEAYYEIALNTLIENVASLGIERCLLRDLSDLIPATEAMTLSDDTIESIAGESHEVVAQRTTAESQMAALDEVIRVCRPMMVDRSGGNSIVEETDSDEVDGDYEPASDDDGSNEDEDDELEVREEGGEGGEEETDDNEAQSHEQTVIDRNDTSTGSRPTDRNHTPRDQMSPQPRNAPNSAVPSTTRTRPHARNTASAPASGGPSGSTNLATQPSPSVGGLPGFHDASEPRPSGVLFGSYSTNQGGKSTSDSGQVNPFRSGGSTSNFGAAS